MMKFIPVLNSKTMRKKEIEGKKNGQWLSEKVLFFAE